MAVNSQQDATELYWNCLASSGINVDQLKALADRLIADFRADEGGFAVLSALPMPQRAIVSDQIVGAIQGAGKNLSEARQHEEDLQGQLADGVPFDDPDLKAHERSTRIDMALVGFFRGVGSALDCLAAGAIGILRLPYSVRRASLGRILYLPDKFATQQPAWSETKNLVDHLANDPQGWLVWTLEMRNALMHRPRLMSLMLQRPTPHVPLYLPESVYRLVMRERIRFDHYLRRRPWLPDMQHLADQKLGALTDAVLHEPATQTTRGVFTAANRLSETFAGFLLDKWDDEQVAKIAPPEQEWEIEAPLNIEFEGFAPRDLPDVDAGLFSPADEERIRLAAELQKAGG